MKTQQGCVYAHIQSSRVSWIFTQEDLPEFNENDIEVVEVTNFSPTPQVGWGYDAGVFTAPSGPSTDVLKAQISARRYVEEARGINHDGVPIETDRDSQTLLAGVALAVTLDANYSCKWKSSIGFVTLNAPRIIAITSAVRAHVQACFDREAELITHLDAGTYSDEMLDEGWPR